MEACVPLDQDIPIRGDDDVARADELVEIRVSSHQVAVALSELRYQQLRQRRFE